MRRRQLKKFAKRLPKDMQAYRQAWKGGSKRLLRRKKCMDRYAPKPDPEMKKIRVALEAMKRNIAMFRASLTSGTWPSLES